EERVVLILVGLIGSGKSTFATSLEKHLPNFVRCNQDELGDRRSVEDLARASLSQGLSVCVDRTNFNPAQRRYWINIAHEFPGTLVWVIVFDTPYEECARRLQQRTSHPTIKTPEQGMSVLARFASDFQAPVADEGFDRMIYFHTSEQTQPEYSQSQIAAVLQKIRDS
ncbi:P-loop containing nucleoside triphosphate hydrolase protein, partial [Dendrothele bispora CBS 962.96]